MPHKPTPQPESPRPELRDPSASTRAGGAIAALATGVLLLLIVVAVMVALGARDSVVVAVGTSFAAPLAGLLIAGWRRPAMFLDPLERSWVVLVPRLNGAVNQRLESPAQRALFVVAVIAALPWLSFGLIGQMFETSSFREYWRSTFYPLFNTLLELGRWGYEPRWFDWSMLGSVISFALAFSWRHTCEPLARWVLGSGKNDA